MESESGEINVLNFHRVSCFDLTKDRVCKVFFYDFPILKGRREKVLRLLLNSGPHPPTHPSQGFKTSRENELYVSQKIFTFLMKTLPEAQRTQSIDFITSITFLTELNYIPFLLFNLFGL